jgi:hypothetical protein
MCNCENSPEFNNSERSHFPSSNTQGEGKNADKPIFSKFHRQRVYGSDVPEYLSFSRKLCAMLKRIFGEPP